jgi:hypothetical protein
MIGKLALLATIAESSLSDSSVPKLSILRAVMLHFVSISGCITPRNSRASVLTVAALRVIIDSQFFTRGARRISCFKGAGTCRTVHGIKTAPARPYDEATNRRGTRDSVH